MDIADWPNLCLWHAHTVWIAPMPWRSVTGWSPMPVPVFSGRSIFFSCWPGSFRRKTCDLPHCLSVCPAWPQLLSHCLSSVPLAVFSSPVSREDVSLSVLRWPVSSGPFPVL